MCNVHLHKTLLSLKQKACSIKLLDQILAQAIASDLTHGTPTWNCIIRAYSKSPTPIKAIFVYNHFIKTGSIRPDNYTYPALLQSCSRLFSIPRGKQAHAHVVKTGLDDDIYVQNALLRFYGTVGRLEDAHLLFDEMPKRDVASWNTLMGVYSADSGSATQVMGLFKMLMRECGGADNISLVILLSAYSKAKTDEQEYGRAVHGYMMKVGLGCFLNVNNAMLDLYIKCKQADAAWKLFDEMGSTRDVVAYTILINGYAKMGCLDSAHDIFDQIVDKDLVLWNLMIHAYAQAKQPNGALKIFKQMCDKQVMPDENTMVSVLAACATLSDLKHGRIVHRFINRNNIRQDVFLKTALIDMYSKCGSLEDALLTFYKMGYRDVFAWTTVIEGLANNGYGNEALSMFCQMEEQEIQPNEATFVSALAACSRSGLVEEGCKLFKRMVGYYGLQPKIEHFGCLIDLLSRKGLLHLAEEFVELFPPEQRTIAYKTLLSACLKHSDLVLGEKVAKEMEKLGSQSHESHVLLSNLYALTGKWAQVANTRRKMKGLSTTKEPGISSVLLLKS